MGDRTAESSPIKKEVGILQDQAALLREQHQAFLLKMALLKKLGQLRRIVVGK